MARQRALAHHANVRRKKKIRISGVKKKHADLDIGRSGEEDISEERSGNYGRKYRRKAKMTWHRHGGGKPYQQAWRYIRIMAKRFRVTA